MTLVTDLDLPELDPSDPRLSGWGWHVTANELLDSGKWLARGPLSLIVLDREAGEFFLRSRAAETISCWVMVRWANGTSP